MPKPCFSRITQKRIVFLEGEFHVVEHLARDSRETHLFGECEKLGQVDVVFEDAVVLHLHLRLRFAGVVLPSFAEPCDAARL